jgi:hypothetical protein
MAIRASRQSEDALSPADALRRDVLLSGLMAPVAAGLPAAAFVQSTRQHNLLSST